MKITILFLLISFKIYGSLFDNEFNHYSSPISKLKVCGERCSGTNYIYYLLHANFPTLEKSQLLEYGQKHFLWWVGIPYDANKLRHLKYGLEACYLTDSDHCLFVVVVRNPYDWLRSFFLEHFHVHKDLLGKGFFHFITSEWKLEEAYHELDGQYSEIDNINPITKNHFKNVLELRSIKNANYIKFGMLVKNFLLVKYEDVVENPELLLNFVSEYYQLNKTQEYHPILNLKGSHVPYYKKAYFIINQDELVHINQSLDWEMERKLGYYTQTN